MGIARRPDIINVRSKPAASTAPAFFTRLKTKRASRSMRQCRAGAGKIRILRAPPLTGVRPTALSALTAERPAGSAVLDQAAATSWLLRSALSVSSGAYPRESFP